MNFGIRDIVIPLELLFFRYIKENIWNIKCMIIGNPQNITIDIAANPPIPSLAIDKENVSNNNKNNGINPNDRSHQASIFAFKNVLS
jgi:hypothetical protein